MSEKFENLRGIFDEFLDRVQQWLHYFQKIVVLKIFFLVLSIVEVGTWFYDVYGIQQHKVRRGNEENSHARFQLWNNFKWDGICGLSL